MINVELAERAVNKKSFTLLKHHVPLTEQAGQKILFNCECSDPQCSERILLTLKDYERLHTKNAQFVIVKDHVAPAVEEIKASDDTIAVVEKFALKN